MRNEENKLHCECGICYRKSYKTNTQTAKHILKDQKVKKSRLNLSTKLIIKMMNKKYLKLFKKIGKTIILHAKIDDWYEEIYRCINMYVNDRIRTT